MLHIGPFIITRRTEYNALRDLMLTTVDAATSTSVINADLQAACQAADAYLHARYPRLDAEQQALCDQIVAACAAAYAALAAPGTFSDAARARIAQRVRAELYNA